MQQETGPEDFARAMRRLRDERGLSLAELAAATRYSKSHLSNIEHGRKRPHSDLAERLDRALRAGGELRRLCEVPAPRPGQRTGPCPYRGLASFEQGDARWFFGREKVTALLAERVRRAVRDGGPVVVVGASGAGKSSLLRAGLLCRAAEGALGSGDWQGVMVTPGPRPVDALAHALATAVHDGEETGSEETVGQGPVGKGPLSEGSVSEEPVRKETVREGSVSEEPVRKETVREEPLTEETLAERIRAGAPLPGTDRILLIVDQLEETFSLCEDTAERTAFLDALCAVPLAVLAVRADFVDHCLTHPGLVSALHHPVALGGMSRGELAETVRGPAELAGLSLEPGLVDVLLHDLDPGGHGYDPGALPLLSHALLATWQQRTGKRLTIAGYHRTGGIRGAVAETAERTYLDLSGADRAAARRLMLRLVQVGDEGADTRRRTDRNHLGADEERALAAFTQARLLTVDGTTVEISHEALLRAWPRLAGWIDADRDGIRTHQRLTEAARAWTAAGRAPELLLQGAGLAVAAQWAADHPTQVEDIESEFLAASTREARRGLRRLRRALAALVGLTTPPHPHLRRTAPPHRPSRRPRLHRRRTHPPDGGAERHRRPVGHHPPGPPHRPRHPAQPGGDLHRRHDLRRRNPRVDHRRPHSPPLAHQPGPHGGHPVRHGAHPAHPANLAEPAAGLRVPTDVRMRRHGRALRLSAVAHSGAHLVQVSFTVSRIDLAMGSLTKVEDDADICHVAELDRSRDPELQGHPEACGGLRRSDTEARGEAPEPLLDRRFVRPRGRRRGTRRRNRHRGAPAAGRGGQRPHHDHAGLRPGGNGPHHRQGRRLRHVNLGCGRLRPPELRGSTVPQSLPPTRTVRWPPSTRANRSRKPGLNSGQSQNSKPR
ncbi:hypothetical protein SAURM35S_06700 [Streptomyces aurantiogriseus]